MNSTGWGGMRVGSGQKPHGVGPGGDDPGVSEEPPADLPEDQQGFWRTYAPLAIERETLTKHTEASFRLLCEMDAEKRATKATLEKDGRTYIKVICDSSGQEHQELKAHPLTGAYGRLAKHVEALLARFGLAPFGKPVSPTKPKPKANPFSQVGGGLK